jgi:hypothetical protein
MTTVMGGRSLQRLAMMLAPESHPQGPTCVVLGAQAETFHAAHSVLMAFSLSGGSLLSRGGEG